MSNNETLQEARRIMEVCNACRYCGGFCAVFPAMEKRRKFPDGDLEYLANLCHNCAGCFHACQYIPPHEFCLNVPKTFAELRAQTYEKYAWPSVAASFFHGNGRAISLLTAISCLAIFLLTWTFSGSSRFFAAQEGTGAFYRIISYRVMIGGGLVLFLLPLVASCAGLVRFIRGMGSNTGTALQPSHLIIAIRDVLTLRYLGGAGDGCNDVDDTFTHLRRWLHQMVFYGFASCLLSTTAAAVYDHFLHHTAPYAFFSLPVLSGFVGGIAIMAGTGGLFFLKLVRDPRPTVPELMGMDIAFSAQLFCVSLSGLLLLAFRGTQAMGILLVLHLGLVASLFLSAPYGKFAHALYRFAALVRYAAEGGDEGEPPS
jgi:citrate/tricarballylate utilization protein